MTVATAQDLASIDISDHALWRDDPPYEIFAQLRRDAPVHWSPLSQFPHEKGFWSIVRQADMKAISIDWETFSSEEGGMVLVDDIGVPLDLARMQPISQDPPRHDRVKALFQQAFTPKRISAHTEAIRVITNHAIDQVAQKGECDLVKDIGMKTTARVIGSLLGTPPEDDAQLVEWSNIGLGFEDSDLRPDFGLLAEIMGDAFNYVLPMVQERRANPTDDLTSALAAAEVDGERFNDARW